MLNILKAAAAGVTFTAAIVGTGGLALIAMLAWQACRDPFFEGGK